jgi:exopolysaccharide biosynthesis polyprenyl glycosylphosphotransferase
LANDSQRAATGLEDVALSPLAPERAEAARPGEAPDGDELPPTFARMHPRRRSILTGRGLIVTTIVLDVTMLLLAIAAALVGANAANVDVNAATLIWIYPPIVIGLLALRGMYRPKITLRFLDEAGHVIGANSVAAMVVVSLAAMSAQAEEHAQLAARVWVFGIAYVAGGRFMLAVSQRKARRDRTISKPTLIVGAGKIGAQVERRLREQPELGLEPVGYIDAFPADDNQLPRRAPILGGPDELGEIAERLEVEHVVLAFLSSRGSDAKLVQLVRQCDELGLEVSLVPRLFEAINVRVHLEHIGGMPIYRLRAVRPGGWQFAVKYVIDRMAAMLLVLVLSPVVLACTLAVKLTSRGPVFYRQRRVGRDGRPFDLLKFRSMYGEGDDKEANANVSVLLPGDTAPGGIEGADRRTRVGKLLRRTSLDELPQLFNVLKGDMSIVGPRPERPQFVEMFERRIERYDDRHRVKAGITGWAQVHGLRGKTSLTDRIELDNFYIENWSLYLDLKILVMTVGAVFYNAE